MNCATRLVDLFGSQAEVARRWNFTNPTEAQPWIAANLPADIQTEVLAPRQDRGPGGGAAAVGAPGGAPTAGGFTRGGGPPTGGFGGFRGGRGR